MRLSVCICSLVAVLSGVLSANRVVAEDDTWDKRREVSNVFRTARQLGAAIHLYAKSADKVPADAADLPAVFKCVYFPTEFPRLPLAWHDKAVIVREYRGDPNEIITLHREGGRGVTFTLEPDALKDTGQLMYATGKAAVGGGPERPYAVLWFDCTHDKGGFDVRMCSGGVVQVSFGRSGGTGWVPMMDAERFRIENLEPTEEHLKMIRGQSWAFYQDSEGPGTDSFYPPSLDDLVPLFLENVPGKRHLTYDPLNGAIEVRKNPAPPGRR